MTHRMTAAGAAFALALLGCGDSDSPTQAEHDEAELEEAQAALTLSADHVHTLDEISFTALLTDHHGEALHDVDSVWVQRRLVGDERWRGTLLNADTGTFTGAYTFSTSGEYEVRVVAKNAGDASEIVLYEMDEHLHVGRAHETIDGVRVEFESFPGHVHQGQSAAMRFWILEAERNEDGVRPPISGLTPQVTCNEEDGGATETHDAAEVDGSYYEAEHTFASAGEFHARVEFTAADGAAKTADFHFDVAHGH